MTTILKPGSSLATGREPFLSTGNVLSGREPELPFLRRRVQAPLIVHVDDNPAMRSLARLILDRFGGFRLMEFENGDEALAYIERVRPDLLITDYTHGGIGGMELCAHLRDNPATRDVPILMLTTAPREMSKFAELRISYLQKPFAVTQLQDTVRNLVYDGRARAR